MNQYVTGAIIKQLREGKGMTQAQLAARLQVSDKAVSRWETAKGYPDITLIEPLAQALDISVMELLSGDWVTNANRAGNLLRSKWYVCPICGNILHSTGAAVVSCCGLTLPPLEAELPDGDHAITVEPVEDEYYVTVDHPMEKGHFLSFLAGVSDEGVQLVKLYPEGSGAARLKLRRMKWVYAYCNRHGLFRCSLP
ncbi:helix-turn-helix domain-containing protein [Evtepia sp.]